MKIGFDATSLLAEGKGVARFQREFLRAAAEHRLLDELDVFVPQQPDEDALPTVEGWRYHHVETRPLIAWEQLRRPLLARRLGLDVIVTLSERSALWGPPQVVYIYEHPRHRASRSREVGTSLRQRLVDVTTLWLFTVSVRRAAVVLAASQSTARDLAPVRRATVVYSGVSESFSPGHGKRSYLLHLASDDPRDNSALVIDAYAAYEGARPPLVLAGPMRTSRVSLEERARRAGVAGTIRWLGFQRGEQLVDLYRNAIAYVDPSLYEGFGLQAAEALACGTPVIASNRTSLPEVVGDAGILLDPHDVRGFAAAMKALAEDDGLHVELSEKAVAQSARFRWEATVQQTLEACTAIVKNA